MPRIARAVAINMPHHITQRGNFRQNVFENSKDREKYLEWFQESSQKNKLTILAYCLMTNHVHFIVTPEKKDSIARVMNYCAMKYSLFVNKKKNRSGHLWQGRYYSCILGEDRLLEAIRYVERNPVRANIAKKAWKYEWSSAGEHAGERRSKIQLGIVKQHKKLGERKWKEYLERKEGKEFMEEVRNNTLTGRPIGGDGFIGKLEKMFGRRLKALPRGRPWKTVKNKR